MALPKYKLATLCHIHTVNFNIRRMKLPGDLIQRLRNGIVVSTFHRNKGTFIKDYEIWRFESKFWILEPEKVCPDTAIVYKSRRNTFIEK